MILLLVGYEVDDDADALLEVACFCRSDCDWLRLASWRSLGLGRMSAAPARQKVGTLQRLPDSGNIISFHISFQYERAKEFHGRERCTS